MVKIINTDTIKKIGNVAKEVGKIVVIVGVSQVVGAIASDTAKTWIEKKIS